MGEPLQKKELKKLYKEAVYQHVLKEGENDYITEVKARRRMAFLDEL